MKCLALNSSGKILSIAIVDSDKDEPLYLFNEPEKRDQGNNIVSYVDKAMTETGLKYEDIDVYGVVTGPGSFTGIRVGISAVLGFSMFRDVPVVGVSAFDLFASTEEEKLNVVAIESWREELYFAFRDEFGREAIPPVNISPKDLIPYMEMNGYPDADLVISGDAADKLVEFFVDVKFINWADVTAADVAKIAMSRVRKEEKIKKPVPYYLRPADVSFSNQIKRSIV